MNTAILFTMTAVGVGVSILGKIMDEAGVKGGGEIVSLVGFAIVAGIAISQLAKLFQSAQSFINML